MVQKISLLFFDNCYLRVDNNVRDDHDPVWCFLENVRDPSNPKSGCYSDTRWSAKDGRFWSARACDGLPPIEGNEIIEVNKRNLFDISIIVLIQ